MIYNNIFKISLGKIEEIKEDLGDFQIPDNFADLSKREKIDCFPADRLLGIPSQCVHISKKTGFQLVPRLLPTKNTSNYISLYTALESIFQASNCSMIDMNRFVKQLTGFTLYNNYQEQCNRLILSYNDGLKHAKAIYDKKVLSELRKHKLIDTLKAMYELGANSIMPESPFKDQTDTRPAFVASVPKLRASLSKDLKYSAIKHKVALLCLLGFISKIPDDHLSQSELLNLNKFRQNKYKHANVFVVNPYSKVSTRNIDKLIYTSNITAATLYSAGLSSDEIKEVFPSYKSKTVIDSKLQLIKFIENVLDSAPNHAVSLKYLAKLIYLDRKGVPKSNVYKYLPQITAGQLNYPKRLIAGVANALDKVGIYIENQKNAPKVNEPIRSTRAKIVFTRRSMGAGLGNGLYHFDTVSVSPSKGTIRLYPESAPSIFLSHSLVWKAPKEVQKYTKKITKAELLKCPIGNPAKSTSLLC